MKIIALDPSGNYGKTEGWGTTGIAFYIDGNVELEEIKASDFECKQAYWDRVLDTILYFDADYVVYEGYRLYNHKGKNASMQSQSEMPTCKLIGIIEYMLWKDLYEDDELFKQFAADVKTRWSDDILVNLGILERSGSKLLFKGEPTNTHKRDALRHLCHFKKYKLPKGEVG